MYIQPYLFLDGRCEEAIEFYEQSVGAEVTFQMRFKDSPEPPKPGTKPPGTENKIMHAEIKIGESRVLLSDGNCQGKPTFQGFCLTLIVATEAEAQQRFNDLGDGGHVEIPLTQTFFSPAYGMVTDRFGVLWMIYVNSD